MSVLQIWKAIGETIKCNGISIYLTILLGKKRSKRYPYMGGKGHSQRL